MEIFETRYYNVNRIHLMLIGLWPFTSTKYIAKVINMGGFIILLIPQLISAIVNHKDIDRFILNILVFFSGSVMLFKLIALTVSDRKIEKLLKIIANNWLEIQDEEERNILIEYSERARLFTLSYTGTMVVFGAMLSLIPCGPLILRLIQPDKHWNHFFMLAGEYFVDRNLYPALFVFLDMSLTVLVASVTSGADSMYICCGEHISAINAIISHRLKNLKRESADTNSPESEQGSYAKIVSIIKLHQRTLSFTTTMNDSYSLTFLFITVAVFIIIPTNACAVIAAMDKPLLLAQYVVIFIAVNLHNFVLVFPGQRILNHNLELITDAYCNQWYELPTPSKKLLAIFMLRCSEPAYLTAGGLFMLDYELYSRVMRTAVSYITVLSSFR